MWRQADGQLLVWFGGVAGNDRISYNNQPGLGDPAWKLQGVGDFDHDGRDDLLWGHTSGALAIWLVQGARFNGDIYPPPRDPSWKVKGLLHEAGR